MARKGVYGAPADKLTRLALHEQDMKRIDEVRETKSPPVLRLALAAVGGIFLLMGETSGVFAWIGAAAFMLAIAGARPEVGAAAGAITAAVAWFRVLGPLGGGIFWLAMLLYITGGVVAGALGAVISRRLPAPAFAFIAPLLPAGLEMLGSFGTTGWLSSTALTQYGAPVLVRVARIAGLPGVTYVVFLFGAVAASLVRFIMRPDVLVKATAPPAGLLVVAVLYGAMSGSRADREIHAQAYNDNSLSAQRSQLAASIDYSADAWNDFIEAACRQAQGFAERPLVARAMTRAAEEVESGGADLMVWPEASVFVNAATRETFLTRLTAVARASKCVEAAGVYDEDTLESRAAVAADGHDTAVGYARRRYVTKVDDDIQAGQVAARGTAPPGAFDTAFGRIGCILSLDANDFSNFRSIARDGGRLVCVLGADDELVPATSVPLLVFNAARAGMPAVRAARNGEMALISANGEVLKEMHTLPEADSTLESSIHLGKANTAYLALGDAFGWLALLAGLGIGLYATALPAPPEEGQKREESYGPLKYRGRRGEENV